MGTVVDGGACRSQATSVTIKSARVEDMQLLINLCALASVALGVVTAQYAPAPYVPAPAYAPAPLVAHAVHAPLAHAVHGPVVAHAVHAPLGHAVHAPLAHPAPFGSPFVHHG